MSLFTSSSRSSTSPRAKRYLGWGLIGFVLLLVLSEVYVFRNIDVYGRSPGFIGQFAELENSFAAADASRIEVAIFGDSQSMDAVRPELIEARLGADAAGTVFNFSVSGGSAFDINKVFEMYEGRVPNVKQAIVVVNEHQLNNALAAADVKFKFFAGLGERLPALNKENYGELLLGWALRSYGLREQWTGLLRKYREGKLREEIPAHYGGLAPVVWSKPEDRTEQYARDTADRWFDDYTLGRGVRTIAFDRLIRGLRDRDIPVRIVMVPRTSIYEGIVREKYGAEQQAFLDLVDSVATKYGAEFIRISGDIVSDTEHFRDTNHVNPSGAAMISDYVADHIVTR